MSSQTSGSETSAFNLLHPKVQRWIWAKNWTSLRDIQEQAFRALLQTEDDLLIAAATASGKTEAAFLPILSRIAEQPQTGIGAMYVGPLKALINDQFLRLEELCEDLGIAVTKWHGDASVAGKRKLRADPSGVLLITPESIEAIFVRRPSDIERMFGKLRFIVIDEVHSFIDSERGVQLASQLKRLSAQAQTMPRRIGLSATIGDLELARNWMRPEHPEQVAVVESKAQGSSLKLQIRGVEEPPPDDDAEEPEDGAASAVDAIAQHLFVTLRGKGNHLVFAGSRRATETFADRLRMLCDAAGVPNEFFPHHGNLSREMREGLEQRLKDGKLPTTAVATTTLELGIDIGSVESVAQIGAPASLSSLRQRLGRSGRREGAPAILRIYTRESGIDARTGLFDRLRVETVQAVAAVRLLLARWVEPPSDAELHLSTMLHQSLSAIVQRGGGAAPVLYRLLAGPGPFASVPPALYAELLQDMAASGLIEQAPDGILMCGPAAERLTSHYDFYSVFVTQDEFTIVAGNKALGTLSVTNALGPGDFLIFAGRRWKVCDVDEKAKKIMVEPAPAGRVPRFEGEAAPLHDRLVEEIQSVYRGDDVPVYLDETAKRHLAEGRAAFLEFGLTERSLVEWDGRTYLFPWKGSRKLDSLRLALRAHDCICDQGRIAISVSGRSAEAIAETLRALADAPPSAERLAALAENLQSQKYDRFLSEDLLRRAFAANRVEADAVGDMCRDLIGGASRH